MVPIDKASQVAYSDTFRVDGDVSGHKIG